MVLGLPRHNTSMMPPTAIRVLPHRAAEGQTALDRGLSLGLSLFALALVVLIGLQYTLPTKSDAVWGLNLIGLRQYQHHLGLDWVPTLDVDTYSLYFRLLMLLGWCGYALAVLSGYQGATLQPRRLCWIIGGAALVSAISGPPLLSHDVYAYAAHGRLYADYGMNPYFTHSSFLKSRHDPVSAYITWDNPTVYGPVWTWIEIASAALTRTAGLWTQIVLLKLVEAAALIAAALAGRRLTQRLCPGRENLTLLAIGLNPLLLLEGLGSGHNDLLLIAFFLLAALCFTEKKYALAAVLLGLSVGVKLITLAVLPWLLWQYLRSGEAKVYGKAAVGLLLVALPTVMAFSPLWHGAATLVSIHDRSAFHTGHGVSAHSAALHLWVCSIVYAALTLTLSWKPSTGSWLTAWSVLAATLMFYAFGNAFCWYIIWFWPVCLIQWNRLNLGLSTACFGLSLIWMAGYGITYTIR